MGNINSLSKSWLNKDKHKDFKKHISAPFVEKRATFKGTITRKQVQDAVQVYIAEGGQIQKLEQQEDVWMQKDDVQFEIEMSKLRRGLRAQLTDLQARDTEFIKMEVA